MSEDESPIYTIGYGGRPVETFIALLQQYGIACLVDVRSTPYSRFRPDYRKNRLRMLLEGAGIRYVFMGAALGGRPADPSCYRDGQVDYELVRERPFYWQGIQQLLGLRQEGAPLAVMCAEARPADCHRAGLIGATLLSQGVEVRHIDETGALLSQAGVNRSGEIAAGDLT